MRVVEESRTQQSKCYNFAQPYNDAGILFFFFFFCTKCYIRDPNVTPLPKTPIIYGMSGNGNHVSLLWTLNAEVWLFSIQPLEKSLGTE